MTYILANASFKTTYRTIKVYILSAYALFGNQTHNLVVVNKLLALPVELQKHSKRIETDLK